MNLDQNGPLEPERHYAYLHLLARSHLRNGARGPVDASDMVQQAMLQAHRKREQFRGQTEAEFRGWLRRILANVIADAFQKQQPKAVLQELDNSAARLDHFLQGEITTPSQRVQRQELHARLAAALDEMPDDMRAALELRYLEQPPWPLDRIAEHLGRPTPKAVAGLLARALEKLRASLGNELP
jgi:RNA polymerase sigma-70 factor, ECF subfamily